MIHLKNRINHNSPQIAGKTGSLGIFVLCRIHIKNVLSESKDKITSSFIRHFMIY